MTFTSPFSTTNNHFDRVAWCYDFLAFLVFGNAQRKAQAHFLSLIPDYSRVLLIGGGSGWLLKRLLIEKPMVKVVYLEASPKMMALAQKSTAKQDTRLVEWRCGTEQTLNENDQFDVLITPFILDLFMEEQLLTDFLPPLVRSLASNGLWLFADFKSPMTWWQKVLEKGMYCFFTPLTPMHANHLPDFNACFRRFHFQRQSSQLFYCDFIEASVFIKK